MLQVQAVTGRATVKGLLARAASDLTKISLFGETTADAVVARSTARSSRGLRRGVSA